MLMALGGAVAGHAEEPLHSMRRRAPDFSGRAGDWLNRESPMLWRERAGGVTIVHFWTFGCINCRRNLPVYTRWQKRFSGLGVELAGIHTPEFPHEAEAENVRRKVLEFAISYPVLLDPAQVNWRRWNQQFWPAIYLVDKKGGVRYRWDGELNYANLNGERRMNSLIEALLAEQS